MSNDVFVLFEVDNWIEENPYKFLGVFSSLEKAQNWLPDMKWEKESVVCRTWRGEQKYGNRVARRQYIWCVEVDKSSPL